MLHEQCRYNEVIETGLQCREHLQWSFDLSYYLASSYANVNQMNSAMESINLALQKNPISIRALFLAANIQEHLGQRENAVELLKKIIFINKDEIPAYLELESIYKTEKDFIKAEQIRKQVNRIFQTLPPETAFEYYHQMTAAQLRQELERG